MRMLGVHHDRSINRAYLFEKHTEQLQAELYEWEEVLAVARDHLPGEPEKVAPDDVIDVINSLAINGIQAEENRDKAVLEKKELDRVVQTEHEGRLRTEEQCRAESEGRSWPCRGSRPSRR